MFTKKYVDVIAAFSERGLLPMERLILGRRAAV